MPSTSFADRGQFVWTLIVLGAANLEANANPHDVFTQLAIHAKLETAMSDAREQYAATWSLVNEGREEVNAPPLRFRKVDENDTFFSAVAPLDAGTVIEYMIIRKEVL